VDYRIWKYDLQITDMQQVEMPKGAELLSVANQDGALRLWAKVDADKERESRYIEVIGTGNPIPQDMGVDRRFIGTAMLSPFVWHVFERM
jgi:hypothetical protein